MAGSQCLFLAILKHFCLPIKPLMNQLSALWKHIISNPIGGINSHQKHTPALVFDGCWENLWRWGPAEASKGFPMGWEDAGALVAECDVYMSSAKMVGLPDLLTVEPLPYPPSQPGVVSTIT